MFQSRRGDDDDGGDDHDTGNAGNSGNADGELIEKWKKLFKTLLCS